MINIINKNEPPEFIGGTYIPPYIQYTYNFIKEMNPELTIIVNKTKKLKDNRIAYLQIYIKEFDTAILVDYRLNINLLDTKIINLDKNDFYDIVSLGKLKSKLIKRLNLNNKIMKDRPIQVFKYINDNKNLSKQQFENKLYLQMLDKIMEKGKEDINKLKQKLNLNKVTSMSTLRRNIDSSTNKLKNITEFFK